MQSCALICFLCLERMLFLQEDDTWRQCSRFWQGIIAWEHQINPSGVLLLLLVFLFLLIPCCWEGNSLEVTNVYSCSCPSLFLLCFTAVTQIRTNESFTEQRYIVYSSYSSYEGQEDVANENESSKCKGNISKQMDPLLLFSFTLLKSSFPCSETIVKHGEGIKQIRIVRIEMQRSSRCGDIVVHSLRSMSNRKSANTPGGTCQTACKKL